MTNFVPVNQTQHAGKAWRRSDNYAFASIEAIVPLVSAEFARAAVCMPITFVEQAGRYVPMAMMSPVAGRNLLVGPAGQWLGAYVPAALRGYPFRLGKFEGNEQPILCIDEDSGLVVSPDGVAEEFFDAEGNPTPATKAALDFLVEIERHRMATDLAVAALADAGLIQPWPFTVTADGQETPVNGLFRIDEAALNALDDETFVKLRQSGALPLAYVQLLSMAQVAVFEQLIRFQQQLASPQKAPFSFDGLFAAAEDDTIRFN